jgi:hypothetical protein
MQFRWWDGIDWTDVRRAPPSSSEMLMAQAARVDEVSDPAPSRQLDVATRETRAIVEQVRAAARDEANRAADLFSRRIRSGLEQAGSIVGEYSKLFFRWVRIAVVVAALAVIAWFVLQIFTQITFFDWVGDRVDNFTDD